MPSWYLPLQSREEIAGGALSVGAPGNQGLQNEASGWERGATTHGPNLPIICAQELSQGEIHIPTHIRAERGFEQAWCAPQIATRPGG